MKSSRVMPVLGLVAALFSAEAMAQESLTLSEKATNVQALFQDAYQAPDGQLGDLKINFRADASGQVSEPRLQFSSGAGAMLGAGTCRRRVCGTEGGITYCVWKACGVPGTLVVPSLPPLLDVAAEFENVPINGNQSDLTVRLIKDPTEVNALSNMLELSQSATSE